MRNFTLLLPFLLLASSALGSEPYFAEVVAIKGIVSLEPAHTNLKLGQKLLEGARITVMLDSSLRLKLSDGAAVQLGPLTELELKRNAEDAPLLKLVHGMILAAVKPQKVGESAPKERFELRTNKVSLGIRGTEFFVKQEGDSPTFVCVCSGKVHAKWDAGEIELSGKHHDHPVNIFHTKKKPTSVKDMGSEHNDEEIAALKKLL